MISLVGFTLVSNNEESKVVSVVKDSITTANVEDAAVNASVINYIDKGEMTLLVNIK